MNAHDICRHPIGFLELVNKPAKEQVKIHFAQRYLLANQGNNLKDYAPEKLTHVENKLVQIAWIVNKLTLGRIGTMLDVGCGEGFAMAHFQRMGWKVKGLDYFQAGGSAMNARCLPMLINGDVEALIQQIVQSGQKFDLIWISDVLERVLDPVSLMNQMQKLLNEGGVLVTIVPNDFSPLQEQLIKEGHLSEKLWAKPPDQLSYFDESGLRALGSHTGFQCQYLIGDLPIDWYLYHPSSNYITDSSLESAAHRAKIELENLVAERPIQQVIDFFEAMATLGFGGLITAFFTSDATSSNAYACLKRQKISYQGYTIRTVEPHDIEYIRKWRNEQMDILRQKNEITPAEQLAYYEKKIWPTLADSHPPNLLFAYLIDDQLVGYGGLVHIAWDHSRAEVSFLMNPTRTRDPNAYRGDFLAFLKLMKILAFEDLKLKKLYTETYSTRVHHISVLEAAGFRIEGVLRRHIIVDDQAIDSLIHGYFNDSYAW